jgi:folate-dependent phosphoribosylglycinamide formyltransferase PurN
VVVLCNPSLHTKASAVLLIRAGINVVGIVAARERAGAQRVRSSIKRNGLAAFLSRALSRALCRLLNGGHDRRVYNTLYNRNEIEESIISARVPVKLCARYSEPDVVDWIRRLAPDIIVVHSATIVPRSVRELAHTGLVIGGHPGLTQFFRGGNSSFRAIYCNRPQDVGWTVFHVDNGVDTGDVIAQGRVNLEPGETFVTLDWRAMLCIAEEQARVINQFNNGRDIPRHPYGPVDAETLYWYPTLLEFIRYRLQQRIVR